MTVMTGEHFSRQFGFDTFTYDPISAGGNNKLAAFSTSQTSDFAVASSQDWLVEKTLRHKTSLQTIFLQANLLLRQKKLRSKSELLKL